MKFSNAHPQTSGLMSEQLYRLVVESTSDLISLLDPKGKIIYVSPSYERDLGYKQEELIGRDSLILLHPDDRKVGIEIVDEVLQGKVTSRVVRLRHKKGHFLVYERRGKRVLDDKGKPHLLVMTSYNITDMIEMERRKDEFISTASHELKTPVTTIKGLTQILQGLSKDDPDVSLYLSKLDDHLNRLTTLVNDLLDVSKMESGKLKLQKELFSLDELIKEVCEDLERADGKHRVIFRGSVKRKILADRYRISQVLINLISNAIKFSPKEDEVRVASRRHKKRVEVSVQDFGIGIYKKDLKRVFEPFFQGDTRLRQSFSGLGLGLHISSEIIKRHGGRIWVDSEKGVGSTFKFSIPA